MSLKTQLLEELKGHGVTGIEVDENAKVNGLSAIAVSVNSTDRTEPWPFVFSSADPLDMMVNVITGFLRNRT